MVETDVLIIGAGPAGAAAALLLSRYGVKTLLVNKYPGSSPGPRAHIVNQRTMEILRELGLEDTAKAIATPQPLLGDHVYATSLTGEELGRIKAWGSSPEALAAHAAASPCAMCDLPQLYFEPMVLQAASLAGAQIRFQTEYVSHRQESEAVVSVLKDRLTGAEFQVRSAYLLGADGARSQVAQDIGLAYEGELGLTAAGSLNVEFTADLSPWVAHRPGDMYWFVQPGLGIRGQGIGSLRMIRPWHKWVAVWGYDLAKGPPPMDEVEATRMVHRLLGDDSIPVTIDAWSNWTINRRYAHQLSHERVFCLGDAVHCHSPMAGLGLNTSVQDAYNLSWKLAWVLQGKAAPRLLASYDKERAPVAKQIVEYAYDCGRYIADMFRSLGLSANPSPEQMARSLAQLKEPTSAGAALRAAWREAVDSTLAGFGGAHGVEMNQRYVSNAVFAEDDDGEPQAPSEFHHEASTRPGAPLPHVWLTRHQHRVSTLDVCGKGRFTVLTGLSGQAWASVASAAADKLGIDLDVHVIGLGQSLEDSYGDFARMSGVAENGALLIRPDRFVAWRARSDDPDQRERLLSVLQSILS